MATLNYIAPRTGILVATEGLVTVTPAQGPLFWVIGDTDTVPTIAYKHVLSRGVDKSFNLGVGERLFLFSTLSVDSAPQYAAVSADNPASGNV